MQKNKLFWVGAIFLIGVLSCSKPLSPTYLGYEPFRVEKVGFSNNVIATQVKLYNPNNYPLKVKSASVELFINNNFLGRSTIDSLIELPAKDTTYVPLRLQASAKDLLGNAAKILLNPNVKVKITGSAKAGRGSFFVNVPIDYEGMQKIELF